MTKQNSNFTKIDIDKIRSDKTIPDENKTKLELIALRINKLADELTTITNKPFNENDTDTFVKDSLRGNEILKEIDKLLSLFPGLKENKERKTERLNLWITASLLNDLKTLQIVFGDISMNDMVSQILTEYIADEKESEDFIAIEKMRLKFEEKKKSK